MRRYGELYKNQEPSWPHQFCSDCIIATRGYDFREGQRPLRVAPGTPPAHRYDRTCRAPVRVPLHVEHGASFPSVPSLVAGRATRWPSGWDVGRQKHDYEDRDRIKRNFRDVETTTPPLLYSLLVHGRFPSDGEYEQLVWNLEPKRLGGFQIDQQLVFVGNCTGRSPGFSPRRMRSMSEAVARQSSFPSMPYAIKPPLVTKKRYE